MNKPLGGRAYGSIPHLPGSRLGTGDHHCHVGQEAICTVKPRDRHDIVIVMEKTDGACCSIANIDGQIVALIRAGYTASSAHYEHLRMFGEWVDRQPDRFKIEPGQRMVGEWLALAHGTKYSRLPPDPFVVFDLFEGKARLPIAEVARAALRSDLEPPPIIATGRPMSINEAMFHLEEGGRFGADMVEGAVWRVERKGKVDFLTKYVRPDKVDGLHLPDISGSEPHWHWRPHG